MRLGAGTFENPSNKLRSGLELATTILWPCAFAIQRVHALPVNDLMAPNLAASQHGQIRDMIVYGAFYDTDIAEAVECSRNAVGAIRSNLQCFGRTNAPRNVSGPRRSITPSMREAILDLLLLKPEQYLDELVVFLWDEFEVLVSKSTISRELKSVGWSKKKARQEAQ